MTDYLARKALPGGREAVVLPLTFNRARLAVGLAGDLGFTDAW